MSGLDNSSAVRDLEQPSQLKRFTPPSLNLGDTYLAEDLNTKYTRVKADAQVYGPTDTAYISLPVQPIVDLRDAVLTFQAQTTGGGGTCRFERNIQSIIRQIRVYIGSEAIEDIQNYDVLSGMFYLSQGTDVNQANLSAVATGPGLNPALGGIFDPTQRQTQSSALTRYGVRLHLDSLRQVLPLAKLGQEMRIEIIFNQIGRCLEQSNVVVGDEDFTVRDMYFHYRGGTMSKRLSDEFDAQIATNKYVFPLRSWRHFVSSELGTGTSATISIPSRFKTINRVLACARDSTTVNDLTVFNKTTAFVSNRNLNRYSLIVNGEQFPRDQHVGLAGDPSGTIPQLEWAWCLNKDFKIAQKDFYFLGGSVDAASQLGFTTSPAVNSFMMAWDMRKINDDYRDTSFPAIWANGISTADVSSQMQLEVDYSAGNANPVEYHLFTQYELAVRVRPGGMIDISSN